MMKALGEASERSEISLSACPTVGVPANSLIATVSKDARQAAQRRTRRTARPAPLTCELEVLQLLLNLLY
jgi:hypothetical protein